MKNLRLALMSTLVASLFAACSTDENLSSEEQPVIDEQLLAGEETLSDDDKTTSKCFHPPSISYTISI